MADFGWDKFQKKERAKDAHLFKRNCRECGSYFETWHSRQVYCLPTCQAKREKRAHRDRMRIAQRVYYTQHKNEIAAKRRAVRAAISEATYG